MRNMKFRAASIIFLALLLLNFISAAGFSPSSFKFNLNPDEKQCGTISLISDSDNITISDKWAINSSVDWRVNLFNEDSSYHGLTLTYPKEINKDQRKVEVCISGKYSGEYHGVILLREQQQGNSIIQMGVWMKIIISGNNAETTNTQQTTEETQANTMQTNETNPSSSSITGNVVSEGKETNNSGRIILWMVGVIVVVIFLLLVIYYIKRRIRWQRYGY